MVRYRPIEEKDNRELAGLIRGVLREFNIDRPGTAFADPTTDDLYTLFRNPSSAYWIAEEEGAILGGGGIYPTKGLPADCAELVRLYVLHAARGRGIGKQLMEMSFDSARKLGYQHLYLESLPELDKALTLYERAGFKRLTGPLGNSGHYFCNIWMLKEL